MIWSVGVLARRVDCFSHALAQQGAAARAPDLHGVSTIFDAFPAHSRQYAIQSMNSTRIKVCGVTRADDAVAAAAAGADAIGLVFYPDSPRLVGTHQAREIVAALPPFVTAVGLFLDADATSIEAVLQEVPLDLLQFHGRETASFCRHFGRPYLKALGMADGGDLAALGGRYPDARGLLVDSHRPGERGGTGYAFGWDQLPTPLPGGVVLAGGLAATNVRSAVAQLQPAAVDVSSGVESSPGNKDALLIEQFIEEVRCGECDAV